MVKGVEAMNLTATDALIVVDMQEDFMDGGTLEVKGARGLIPGLNRAVEIFSKKDLPIFFTRDYHPKDHCSFKEQGGPWPSHCVQGTKGAKFASGLLVPGGAEVVSKAQERDRDAYSAFYETGLGERIREMGIRRVLVAGVAIEYCVLETVLDAIRKGLNVFVLTDLVAAVVKEVGQEALKKMETCGAKKLESTVIK